MDITAVQAGDEVAVVLPNGDTRIERVLACDGQRIAADAGCRVFGEVVLVWFSRLSGRSLSTFAHSYRVKSVDSRALVAAERTRHLAEVSRLAGQLDSAIRSGRIASMSTPQIMMLIERLTDVDGVLPK